MSKDKLREIFIYKEYTKEISKENITPPKNPSIVLFGLIEIEILFLPIVEPIKYEKISNDIIIITIKLNLGKLFLLNSLLSKKYREIIKYIKIIYLSFLKLINISIAISRYISNMSKITYSNL